MTRSEHVAWAKARAMEYFQQGDLSSAVASMLSDMGKHPECGVHPAIAQLGMMELLQHNDAGVRRFIEGFN